MKWNVLLNKNANRSLLLGSIVIILGMMVLIRYINKNHLSELQQSVMTIYEDRLVAKDYLFEISRNMHKKKVSLEHKEQFPENSTEINAAIASMIENYQQTKLTVDESLLLTKLREDILLSESLENQFSQNLQSPKKEIILNVLTKQYDLIILDLEQLSEIQVIEGKKLLDKSYQILATSNNSSHLEISLVIILILIIIGITSNFSRVRDEEYSFS